MRARLLIGRLAFVALVAGAAGMQVASVRVAREAQLGYEASRRESAPWNERLAGARTAAALRPDVVAYRQQAASLQAERYTEIGALDKARAMLVEAWGLDRTNDALRAQLREVNGLITVRDSRKAHVLHGREKSGGVLEPDDLMP